MYKQVLKKIFNTFGLELKKLGSLPPPVLHHEIDVVFDVGANIGQYALLTRAEGFKGRMVSFEPLPDEHKRLSLNASKDALWSVHPRCAIGADIGSTIINISKNSYSSSILPILEAHSSAAPESIYIGEVKTPVITLDSVFDIYRNESEKVFLKIDTQGYESEALSGCLKSLPQVRAVQLELSIVPLYEGQEVYRHFFDFFDSNGFYLWSILPGFANKATGQHLQFDAVFVNGRG